VVPIRHELCTPDGAADSAGPWTPDLLTVAPRWPHRKIREFPGNLTVPPQWRNRHGFTRKPTWSTY